MNQRLQELADARGLGALPTELVELAPAPPDPNDSWGAPDRAPPTELDAALFSRTRRGPEEASTRVIRTTLAERGRELELFDRDTAAERVPRNAEANAGLGALMKSLKEGPPADLESDPEALLERLRHFDLDAGWKLARLESGRAILGGAVGDQVLEFASTLERAHCPRWALAQLCLMHHVGHRDAPARIVEILLDEHAWGAAIDFVEALGDASLEAYVAARVPEATLSGAGKSAWLERLGQAQHLAVADLGALSRAQLAHLVGLAELALAQGVAVLDVERLKSIIARFPTWRHAQRVLSKLIFASSRDPALVPAVIDRYVASFGVDTQLLVMLRPHVSPEARTEITRRLVREAVSFPDWVEPWRALARFSVSDMNASMAMVRALA